MIQDVRSRVVVPLAVAVLSGMWACADDGVPSRSVPASPTLVPAPSLDDPVADWELQFLPAIDAHMNSGRLDSVIIVCQLGLAGDSTRIVLYNLMASAYAAQGRFDAATEALETAVRLAPDFTVGWANLGGMFTRLGRPEQALPYLRRAASLDAGNPAVHRRLGEAYRATQRYNEAIIEIRAAMALQPQDATLTFLLGRSQEGLGETEAALASFLRAGTLDPGYGEAHKHASELAGKLGRRDVSDSCHTLQLHLQQVAEGDTMARETMAQLRNAVVDAPENPIHHARLGGFYLYHGYLVEAMALFERAITLGPNDMWLMTEFGGLLSKSGNGAEALDFYLRALTVNPDYGPALINTGGILNALGRHEEAIPYFEHALVLAPENPGIRFFLGVTFISLERPIQAREQLQQALTQLDDSAEAAQLKQQIEAALAALAG